MQSCVQGSLGAEPTTAAIRNIQNLIQDLGRNDENEGIHKISEEKISYQTHRPDVLAYSDLHQKSSSIVQYARLILGSRANIISQRKNC